MMSISSNNNSKKIHDRNVKKYDKIADDAFDVKVRNNILVIGTTGSGKTANSLRYIEEAIKENEEFILCMDGKGSMIEYSIYDVVSKLAQKYNRPIYILNQSSPPEDSDSYNPFQFANEVQIVNMLTSMTSFTEPYYESLVKEYWLFMASVLVAQRKYYNKPISFDLLVKCSDISYMGEVLRLMNIAPHDEESFDIINPSSKVPEPIKNELLTSYEKIKNSKEALKAIAPAASRFSNFANGYGKKLFATHKSFSLRKAVDENAIVLINLNSFSYSDFASSVGRLVIEELKIVLGDKFIQQKPFKATFLFDELSVYFDDRVIDIANKSRELGVRNVFCTQSFADLEAVDTSGSGDVLCRQIIENSNTFVFMRQNDSKGSERSAEIMGTKYKIKTTLQSTTESVEYTGKGTKTLDEEFIVSPNEIRSLPANTGYFYTKDKKDTKRPYPERFKTKFVELT